ncbi:MAG: sigma-54 dependent transcriptional regulator [Vicinamibacterales bacterium]
MARAQSRRRRVLVVDDDPATVDWLKMVIEQADVDPPFEVRAAGLGRLGLAQVDEWRPEIVLLDLLLPDGDGMDVLKRIKEGSPGTEVIVISGQGTIARALDAGQNGAFFFVEKSQLDPVGLVGILERAAHQVDERLTHEALRAKMRDPDGLGVVIGQSQVMRELFDLVEAVAPSNANVLILGENGTGKELIANALHQKSPRASGPFIKINCAAIPKDLIESELFGSKKGAFTGATADKVGLLELAEGGALMLDEIGEMPPFLQTKLLRVLQEREYRPIGSDRFVKVDFRLICATNVDLEAALADGRLREDLYFRINTIQLRVPPLRERTEDIPLLCDWFVEKFARRHQKSVRGVSPAAYHLLIRSRWPGNVRELENAMERAVLVTRSSEIQPGDLPDSLRASGADDAFLIPPHRTLAEIERMAILQTLERTNGNKQEAAQILGLYRPTLYNKMRRHGITGRIERRRPVPATGEV